MANTTPTTFVIFGAGGDLSTRKILPAIFKLVRNKKLKDYCIVGLARRNRTFKSIINEAKQFIDNEKKTQANKIWKQIEQRSKYIQVDFQDETGYADIYKTIKELEERFKLPGNRIFYLATTPHHYSKITQSLERYQLCKQTKHTFKRVVYEKPFGSDLSSAKKTNKCIAKVFKESQVYRIDHYLGKELVGNISLVRFTNRILEPLWSNKHIERIEIVMTESVQVGRRAAFYDRYGQMKDVVQNHLLQLLALITMEEPKTLTGKAIRDAKVQVLKNTKINSLMKGQYLGYKNLKGVKKGSTTDTFAIMKAQVNTKRFKGVPIFIKTGKALKNKQTYIDIKFKKVHCLLDACPRDTNHLRIQIYPNAGISLMVNSKIPGIKMAVTPISLQFSQKLEFGANTPAAYENLLFSAIEGDQSVFVRSDEVEEAWRIIEQATRKQNTKPYPYKKGSSGPKELGTWNKKNKCMWC
tara:strand:+ start:1445 stop:2848 length:1404 start_codon:yes stop_codon:yes gene_type:complete